MKNVLCLKRMSVLQLPSQFFIYTRLFFSKISALLSEETRSDPQFLIVSEESDFKLFLSSESHT